MMAVVVIVYSIPKWKFNDDSSTNDQIMFMFLIVLLELWSRPGVNINKNKYVVMWWTCLKKKLSKALK